MPTIQATTRIPSYRQHKPSRQAVVTLGECDVCLGKWRKPDSLECYERVVSDWLAHGRKLPEKQRELTVAEVALRFWEHAKGYYRKHGQGSLRAGRIVDVWRVSRGALPVYRRSGELSASRLR